VASRAMAALSVASLIWLEVLGPGCGGAGTPLECEAACSNFLALGCSPSCDCTQCSTAVESCSSTALGCAGAVTSCDDLSACLSSASGCDELLSTLCP
jgi:hypothetical protein